MELRALRQGEKRVQQLEEINPLDDLSIRLPKGTEYPVPSKVFIFYKPKFLVCAEDKRKAPRPTVFDYIQEEHKDKEKYFLIGRLDYNASGLLLLTNQQEMAEVLGHVCLTYEYVFSIKITG